MRGALSTCVCLAMVAVVGGLMSWLAGRPAVGATLPAVTVPAAGVASPAARTWALTRSDARRIPRGVRTVIVTLDRPSAPTRSAHAGADATVVLSSPRKVRQAIRLVDALKVLRSGHFVCPMILRRFGVLTVTYSAGPAGPALARAQVSLAGPGSPGSACDPIRLWVRQRLQRPLLGPSFAQQITQLAGLAPR